MATADALRYTRIPLTHGSGAIPAVGFGTLIPDPVATEQATRAALEVGFRHFDCAERYRNEAAVGEALRTAFDAATIRRADVFVTTKLWNTNHRPERVKPAFDASCRRLQVDYVDCYLIHTPFAFRPGDEQDPRDEHGQVIYASRVTFVEIGQAREGVVSGGHCKSIGLSEFALAKVRKIVAATRSKPAVVLVESHPYLPLWELLDLCREHGIILPAFAAKGHSLHRNALDDRVSTTIARRIQMTPAQTAPAWADAARHHLPDQLNQTSSHPVRMLRHRPRLKTRAKNPGGHHDERPGLTQSRMPACQTSFPVHMSRPHLASLTFVAMPSAKNPE